MKRKSFKKYLKVFLGLTVLSPIVVLPIVTASNPHNSIINANHNAGTNNGLKYDWQTNTNTNTTVYSLPSHMKKDNNNITYDLDNSIKQDTAFDDANASYAFVGSSDQNNFKSDVIAKTWLIATSETYTEDKDGTTTDKTEVSIQGSNDWVVKKSDLATQINVTDETKTSISSILYSGGGELTSKSLFVILNSTDTTNQGSFLFQIKYENDKKDLKAQKAGDYRLVTKLSSSNENFNFMALESAATHSIQVFELKDIAKGSTTNNYTIKTAKIQGNGDYNQNTTTRAGLPAPSVKTVTVNSDLLTNKFSANHKYEPIYAYRSTAIGNNAYIVFQQSKEANHTADATKYLTTLMIPTVSGADSELQDITMTNATHPNAVKNVDVTDVIDTMNNTQDITVSFTPNNTSSTMVFFSQSPTTTRSKRDTSGAVAVATDPKNDAYGYLNLNMADVTNTASYKATEVQNGDEPVTDLLSVNKLYNATSEVIGYIFLDKDGKVFQYDKEFKNPKLIFNFKNSTINLGDIYRIVTTPSSASWYAQLRDSTYAQFNGSTFVGQWDKLASNSSYELPIGFNVKGQSQVSAAVITQKVADGESYSSDFTNYLNNGESYKDFLDVTFQDPRLTTSPNITITSSTFDKNETQSKMHHVTLTFKQKLRKVNYRGEIVGGESDVKEVTLAQQTYLFNNAESKVSKAIDKGEDGKEFQPVPAFIKNKLPSQVTKEEVKNYLLVLKNITNETITWTYNDTTGSMRITVIVPYMWAIGTSGDLERMSNQVFTFDYSNFFYSNALGNTASITEIDDAYLEKETNKSLKTSLIAKYGAKLPSSVDPTELINSFVIFGPAFSQSSNYDDGTISPKEEWVTNVVPLDENGTAVIDVTIPKVANNTNVKLSFVTPKVFLSNPNANASVYFMFKQNEHAVNEELKKSKASEIASKLNSSSANINAAIEALKTFADFSNFFVENIKNGIIKINATGYDNYGTLKIVVSVTKDGQKLPGFSSSTLEAVYSGFTKNGNSTNTNDQLKFKDSLDNIQNVSPLNVTAEALMTTYDIFNGTSEVTKAKITTDRMIINRSTISGSIQVIVTIDNYVENGVVYPQKSFTKTYTGFKSSKEAVDMIVWKSFAEIVSENQSYRNSKPSDIINSINTTQMSNKEKLSMFANVSFDLFNKLNENDINIILEGNDGTGELKVTANVKVEDTMLALNTIINCNDNQSLTPEITLVTDVSNDAELVKLREKLPSQLTTQDASKLYTFSNAYSYVKDVILVPDDFKGTLSITARLLTSNGVEIISQQENYTGFAKFIPINDGGTNWAIVAASVVVPTVILLIPIIAIGIIQERKNRKKIARKLDSRLNEEYKKTKKY